MDEPENLDKSDSDDEKAEKKNRTAPEIPQKGTPSPDGAIR
jgi:hypothetical protein